MFILCFGQNKHGELGMPNLSESIKSPKAIQCSSELDSAIHISSGSNHSALVTKIGELFVCGSALHGKLGITSINTTSIQRF
jgi:alpha-tubulin suppressor-like RCC1 family protein